MKEVEEETGIECEPVSLLSVIDGQRMGFSRFGMYMLLFHCRATGGELRGHPLETSGVGWFAESELPEATAGAQWWGPPAFAAIRGETSADHVRPARAPRSGAPTDASVRCTAQASSRAVAEELLDLGGEQLGVVVDLVELVEVVVVVVVVPSRRPSPRAARRR